MITETSLPRRSTALRSRRLAIILGLLLAILALVLLPPWIFVYSMTHPGCFPPEPLADLPKPEEHWLDTTDGLELRAWYHPSRNRAAILALGGTGGSLGTALPPVEGLVRSGYGVLQIGTRACARQPAPVTLGYREAWDAQAGFEFLRSREEIDTHRIGIFGFSMGSAAALRFAANQPEIAAVACDGGYTNLSQNFDAYGTGGPFARITGALAGLAYYTQTGIQPGLSRPIDEVSAISPRPLLLIYGEAEAGIPAQALWEAARSPKELWIVPGGSHGKNHQAAPVEYVLRVVEFFGRALLSQPNK